MGCNQRAISQLLFQATKLMCIGTFAGGDEVLPATMTPMAPCPWPLPAKLVKQILDLEFAIASCYHQSKQQQRGQETDILL